MRRWRYLTKGYVEAVGLESFPLHLGRNTAVQSMWQEFARYGPSCLPRAGASVIVPAVELDGSRYVLEPQGSWVAV